MIFGIKIGSGVTIPQGLIDCHRRHLPSGADGWEPTNSRLRDAESDIVPPNHNDNEGTPALRPESDAHGQAALLLIEATLHALIEAKVFTVGDALSVVETAADVKIDAAEDDGEPTATVEESIRLLHKIAHSLRGAR